MNEFGLKEEVLEFITRTAGASSVEKVVLFGSRATQSFNEKSDIDLAISGQGFHSFAAALEDECPTLLSFDFVNLNQDISNELETRISSEGVVLYG